MLKETIEELNYRINPDTFVTLTMKQGISLSSGAVLYGDPIVYDRVLKALWDQVFAKIYGKRRYKRMKRKKEVLFLTVLERNGEGRWHIHACLKRPEHVSLSEFDSIIRKCWEQSCWSLDRMSVEERRGKATAYSLKTGQDSILLEASCF